MARQARYLRRSLEINGLEPPRFPLTPPLPLLDRHRTGANRGGAMEGFWRDASLSFRSFARNPGFTAVAVLSLALGIGANTAIFTLINAVFLNPLAVKAPSELVAL